MHVAREPEVGEVDLVAPRGIGEQDVRRLDVAVHEPLGVRGVKRPPDAIDDRRRPRRLDGALLVKQRAQIGSLHEAHRDVQHPVRLADRVDRDDVRMLDLRRDARLTLEARAKRRVVREIGRDDLQRDDAVRALLASAVDDAHAPATRDGLDDEAVDLRARPQQRAAHAGSLDDAWAS